MTTDDTISSIETALMSIRIPSVNAEYDIHAMIIKALSDNSIEFKHEAKLGLRRRIDFLVGSVGIEVKTGAPSKRALLAQIEKYAETDAVDAIIIVSTRQMDLPSRVRGKRVVSFGLGRLWGVAL